MHAGKLMLIIKIGSKEGLSGDRNRHRSIVHLTMA